MIKVVILKVCIIFLQMILTSNAVSKEKLTKPQTSTASQGNRPTLFENIDRRNAAFRNIGLIVICTNWALDPLKIQAAGKPYFGEVQIVVNPETIPVTDKKIHFLYFAGEGLVLSLNECLSNFPAAHRTAIEVVKELHAEMKTPREYNLGERGTLKFLPATVQKYRYGRDWVATYALSKKPSPDREKNALATIFGLESDVCITTRFCNYLP